MENSDLCEDLRRNLRQKYLEKRCQEEQSLAEALAIVDWLERNVINAEPPPKFNLPALIRPPE